MLFPRLAFTAVITVAEAWILEPTFVVERIQEVKPDLEGSLKLTRSVVKEALQLEQLVLAFACLVRQIKEDLPIVKRQEVDLGKHLGQA